MYRRLWYSASLQGLQRKELYIRNQYSTGILLALFFPSHLNLIAVLLSVCVSITLQSLLPDCCCFSSHSVLNNNKITKERVPNLSVFPPGFRVEEIIQSKGVLPIQSAVVSFFFSNSIS